MCQEAGQAGMGSELGQMKMILKKPLLIFFYDDFVSTWTSVLWKNAKAFPVYVQHLHVVLLMH